MRSRGALKHKPHSPIPAPLRGNETGTFTQQSIVERLPEIGQRMLAENDFPRPVKAQIETLLREIPDGRIRMLADMTAPDAVDWTGYLAPFLGLNWLDPPWFFVEHYFYRRVIEAIDYFRLGHDPFAHQKARGLETKREAIAGVARLVQETLDQARLERDWLVKLLKIDLWGNQADLSMWPAGPDDKLAHQDETQQADHTLVDQAGQFADHLLGQKSPDRRLDFLIDNAGFELVADLALAVVLLQKKVANTIILHTKPHPTFVSDATNSDVWWTVRFLSQMSEPAASSLGRLLQLALNTGRLRLQHHFFWTSPLDGWQMPEGLRQDLGRAGLLISKGDAHYRRLLGDRHWPVMTAFADIVGYLPAPLVALRTLKSEVAAGLAPGQPETLAQQDPGWLVNGRWGIIQFYDPEER